MSGNTLRIREASLADVSALDELVESTLGERFGALFSVEELRACVRDYCLGRAGETCYVADTGGTLAGYAVVARDISPCGPVERLYVRRTVGGAAERNVAEALVSACGEAPMNGRTMGRRAESTALDLYERWGFVDVSALRRCLSMPSGHGRLLEAFAA